jgi:hypothetical protein
MANRRDDLEHGLRAQEQEERIERNQKLLGNGKHGIVRTNLKRAITDAQHRLGR